MKSQTILVVEDNPITRKMVRVALESEGYAALEAPDGRTALELMKKHAPQLILQDLLLPDIDGFDLLKKVRGLPRGHEIPILAFSGFLSKMDEARTLQVGFTGFLFKPVEPSVLLGAVREYLAPAGPSADQPGRGRRLLLVDDDPLQRKLQQLHLKQLGFEVVAVEDGKMALEQAHRNPPDVIVSDVFVPGLDGFQLCLAARSDPRVAHVPVVLTSCVFVEEEDRRLGRSVGANAFVARSPDLSALKEAILKSLNEPAPRPRAPVQILREEHVLRTTRALERQVTMNSGLARRCSVLSAELSLLKVLSDTLAGPRAPGHLLDQALLSLLDAGAFSAGAAYSVLDDGSFSLQAHLGYSDSAKELLGAFFENTALLHRALDEGEPLSVPSSQVPEDEAADLLAKAGAKSLLITPLVLGKERLGALVMALAHRELEDWVAFSKTIAVHLSQALGLARALERLASSERRYRDLVDGLDAIVWEADAATHKFSFASHRAREILGYPLERWVADAGFWTQHIHPKDRERVAAELETAITAGRSCDLEYRALAADGRVVWIRNMVRVVEACSGCPKQFRGVMVDITAKKQSEEALRETNETLQSLVQASPLPIVALDREEKVHLWNRAAKQVFGWSEQEVLGKPYPLVPDEGRAEYRANLDRILGGEQITNLEIFRQRKDGTRLRVNLSAAPIRDAGGQISSLMAVLEDVTEQKLLEEQFRQVQRLEGIGRLAGGVAHDFNNLVNVINGYSVLLLERLPEGDPLRKYAGEIEKAGARAAILTRQLLAFSRKQVLEPRVLDLNAVVADMARLLQRLIGEDIELITVLAPDLGG